MAEHLDTILRLVAEGKLSAADAEPLLAALSRQPTSTPRSTDPPHGHTGDPDDETSEWHVPPAPQRPPEAPRPPSGPWPFGSPTPPMLPLPPDPPAPSIYARRRLRIEVVEGGRRVVNLRIPLGLAGVAAELVPGLSTGQAAKIREAIRAGMVGPILEVQGDDGDGVVIATE